MALDRDPSGRPTVGPSYDGVDTPYYRRRSAWGWGLGALVVLLALIALFSMNGGSDVSTTSSTPPAATQQPATPSSPTTPAPSPAPRQ
jgi:hypothetical protein